MGFRIRDLNLQRAVFGSVFVDCDQWFYLDLNLSEIGVRIHTCVVLDSIKIQYVRSGVHHLIPHQCLLKHLVCALFLYL